jgi:hypothetical protein
MQFCKEYNAATQDKVGTVIPVEITCFEVRRLIQNKNLQLVGNAASGAPAPSCHHCHHFHLANSSASILFGRNL